MDNENDLFASLAPEEHTPPAPKRRGRPRKNAANQENTVIPEKVEKTQVEEKTADSVPQPDPTAVYAPGIPAAVQSDQNRPRPLHAP